MLQLRDGRVDLFPHIVDDLLDAEVEWLGLEVLVVMGVFADAGGTQGHETIF